VPTRKPFAKLKPADLEQAPIWEWVQDEFPMSGEEQLDESFVEASPFTNIPAVEFGQFVVSAVIRLHNGDTLPGICEATVAAGEVAVNPTIVFMIDRQLQIPAVDTNRLLSRYTQSFENHPVGWTLTVLVEGESELRSGCVKGGDMKDLVAVGLDILAALKSLQSP
jgi:hypothetical protein